MAPIEYYIIIIINKKTMKRTANSQFSILHFQSCLTFVGCCLMLVVMTSCGGSKTETDAQAIDEELSEIVESNEFQENGLMKQRPAELVIDTPAGYKVALFVRPDEGLPRVPNENFGTYCDNRATVMAFTDADTLVSRQFTKADFTDALDDNLKTNAVLDNISLITAEPKTLTLEASVSVPHSDEQAVFTVTLGIDGSLTVQKNAPVNDSFADEEVED